MRKPLIAVLALLLCLALAVPALGAGGLAAFQEPQGAQPGAFSDVPSSGMQPGCGPFPAAGS